MKQELTDAFSSGVITDFVVTRGLMNEDLASTIDENLVLQGENPFVSFAGRLGNTTSLLFTGLSSVKLCSGVHNENQIMNITTGEEDGNSTEAMTATSDDCKVWFDQISWPMNVFTILNEVNGEDGNSTITFSNTEIFGKVQEMPDPIGFVKFELVRSGK